MVLDELRAGDEVIYRAPHLGPQDCGELGVVTSTNELWAFVRFGGDDHSKACAPALLTRKHPSIYEDVAVRNAIRETLSNQGGTR